MNELKFFLYKGDKIYDVPASMAIQWSLRQLCNNPLALRFNVNGKWVYFTADERIFNLLTQEGKQPRFAGELFEALRLKLRELGFDSSIYDWSLERIFSLKWVLETFPGGKEVKDFPSWSEVSREYPSEKVA